ncbi:FAD-dependent monooxygenase nscC-like [Teratosphaeria destructans]|uniref:FAD-dependent monooxygenase nscC-like n=1 Tax=Teratosphaeria destructans TaxID=418781 RepID=A0A9W7SP56_9PEZI|nr:FAD-dependent monooxygenase nscC-like [Teratosphaeria destructans]
MPRPPISIIGAGISGLTLSRCLQRRKVPFVLYERDTSEQISKRHNYAITISPRSRELLISDAGLDANALNGTFVDPSPSSGEGQKSVRVNRRKLESALRQGIQGMRYGHKLQDVKLPTSGSDANATVLFENGEQTPDGSTIIGADGAHSAVRKAIAPEADFTIHSFPAINGKRRLQRSLYEAQIAPYVSDLNHVLEHKSGCSIFGISIDDVKDETVDLSYTYSRPRRPAGEADALYTPDRPNSGAKDIPPQFYEEIATLHPSLPAPFDLIFESDTLKKDRLLSWLMRSVSVPREASEAAAGQGMVLVGEAVHLTPILGSYGANEGIEDAVALAGILERGTEVGLFVGERVAEWERWVGEGVGRLEAMHGVGEGGGARL